MNLKAMPALGTGRVLLDASAWPNYGARSTSSQHGPTMAPTVIIRSAPGDSPKESGQAPCGDPRMEGCIAVTCRGTGDHGGDPLHEQLPTMTDRVDGTRRGAHRGDGTYGRPGQPPTAPTGPQPDADPPDMRARSPAGDLVTHLIGVGGDPPYVRARSSAGDPPLARQPPT